MTLVERLRSQISQFSELLKADGALAPSAFLDVTLGSIPAAAAGSEVGVLEELLALVRLRRACYGIADNDLRLRQYLESQAAVAFASNTGARQ